jgi:hypothetical protein
MEEFKLFFGEWGGLLATLGVVIAILALVASAFMHLAAKIDVLTASLHLETKEIRQAMSDFRVLVAQQDSMYRSQLAEQNAEFKAHMIYYHSVKT